MYKQQLRLGARGVAHQDNVLVLRRSYLLAKGLETQPPMFEPSSFTGDTGAEFGLFSDTILRTFLLD